MFTNGLEAAFTSKSISSISRQSVLSLWSHRSHCTIQTVVLPECFFSYCPSIINALKVPGHYD